MKEKSTFDKSLKHKVIQYGIIAFVVSSMVFISYFLISNTDKYYNAIMWFFNKLFGALTPLFLAFIIAYILNKPVTYIEKLIKNKHSRILGVSIVYLFIVGVLICTALVIVPMVKQNAVNLINDFPRFSTVISDNINNSIKWINNIDWMNNAGIGDYISNFTSVSSKVLGIIISSVGFIAQGIGNFLLAMLLAVFLLINKDKILKMSKDILRIFGGKIIKNKVIAEAKVINTIFINYITGMITNSIILFVISAIGLYIIGVKYFLIIAIMIALLNLIPYFGAIVACVIAVILSLFQGVPLALATGIFIIVMQIIDGNIIQPKIVGDKVGLGPIWVITAVLVFGAFWGIPGMLIGVPIVALLKTIVVRIIENRRQKENHPDNVQ